MQLEVLAFPTRCKSCFLEKFEVKTVSDNRGKDEGIRNFYSSTVQKTDIYSGQSRIEEVGELIPSISPLPPVSYTHLTLPTIYSV